MGKYKKESKEEFKELKDKENENIDKIETKNLDKNNECDDGDYKEDDEYEEKYNSFRIPICGSVDWVLPAICLPVCLLHRQSHE